MAAEYRAVCNSWRTGYDLSDQWSAILQNGFTGLKDKVEIPSPAAWAPFTGPGHFADLDMLVIGLLGDGKGPVHPSHLTPEEQYTLVSQWALMASPILAGCDLEHLNAFTLGLLTDDEVLDIDQDPLGMQATRVTGGDAAGTLEVWARDLEDGSKAVGLYNRRDERSRVTIRWSALDIHGRQRVRDLWRQRDVGIFDTCYQASVPAHGVNLIRIIPAAQGAPVIVQQPADAESSVGRPVTFSILVVGKARLHYQWMRNGVPIPGGERPGLVLAMPTAADNGASFRCIVTNSIGRVISYEGIFSVRR